MQSVSANGVSCRALFQAAPVSIWEAYFSAFRAALEALRKTGVTDIRNYMSKNPAFRAQAAPMVKVLDVNDATLQLFAARDRMRR